MVYGEAVGCTASVAYCGVSALRDMADTLHFDTFLIGGVLQHVRHPVDLLWAASKVSDEIIVTNGISPIWRMAGQPLCLCLRSDNDFLDTWWYLSSTVVANFLKSPGLHAGAKAFVPVPPQRCAAAAADYDPGSRRLDVQCGFPPDRAKKISKIFDGRMCSMAADLGLNRCCPGPGAGLRVLGMGRYQHSLLLQRQLGPPRNS